MSNAHHLHTSSPLLLGSSTWSFDDFLSIDKQSIIHSRRKPRSIIVIHKSCSDMMLVGDEHTTSSGLK